MHGDQVAQVVGGSLAVREGGAGSRGLVGAGSGARAEVRGSGAGEGRRVGGERDAADRADDQARLGDGGARGHRDQGGHGDHGAFGELHAQVGEAGAVRAGGQLDRGQQLAGGQGGLVQAGQELRRGHPAELVAPLADQRGSRREQERGRVGVRVGEAEVAAQGADRTHPQVRHLRDHRGHLRVAVAQRRGGLDLVVRGGGADAHGASVGANAAQAVHSLQVDQVLIASQAELHGQQQLGAAAVGGPVIAQVGEQARGLPGRTRAMQGERRQLHSVPRVAAVGGEHLAGDPVRLLRGQERHRGSDVGRHRTARDGLQRHHEVERLGVRAGHHPLAGGQAGGDRVDRDAVRADLGGQRPGEREHRTLGGHVVGHVRGARRDHVRGDVHDPAVPGPLHVRVDRLAHQEHPVDVHRHDPPPLREIELLPRHERHDRRVVDQDVDCAEPVRGRRDQRAHLIRVAHVGDVRGPADLRRGLLRGLGVLIRHDHAGTLGAQLLGDGPADALTRTGDDRDTTLEFMLTLRSSSVPSSRTGTVPSRATGRSARRARGPAA